MKFFNYIPAHEGFDTETYKGNLKLLTCSSGYIEYHGHNHYEILNWLYNHGSDYNWFFNIKFDMSVLLKPFTEDKENYRALMQGKGIIINDLEIDYLNGKSFSIKKANTRNKRYPKKHYFDVANFYGKGRSLDSVAKEELGEGKNNDELGIDRAKIGSIEGYYEANRDAIIKYGIQDAKLTKDLGIKFAQSLAPLLKGNYPKMLNSGASVSKAYLTLFHDAEANAYWKLLKSDNVNSKDAFNTILQTYKGGLFHLNVLGKTENAKEIDLNSAYPYALTQLKSIVNGEILKVNKYVKADYGFYKVKYFFSGKYPVPYNNKLDSVEQLIYPVSIEPVVTFMTAIEYEFLKSKNEDIEVVEGYIINTEGKYEFNDYKEIYEQRKIAKHTDVNKANNLKLIMNSTYGSFAQSRYGMTQFTNYIYASYITAMTRVKIYEGIDDLQAHGDTVLSIMTDAIAYTGDYNPVSSEELGDYKQEMLGKDKPEATIRLYMNGIYSNNGIMMRSRGFANITRYSKEILETKGNIFTAEITKPTTLKEGIIQHRAEDIADFTTRDRSIDLQANLNKYELPVDKLTFEYLNDNSLKTEPVTVSEGAQLKEYDVNNFNTKLENAYHSKKHFIPAIDNCHTKEFIKLSKWISGIKKQSKKIILKDT